MSLPIKTNKPRRPVAPEHLNTQVAAFITPITSKTRIVIIIDDHEHALLRALDKSNTLQKNQSIAWAVHRLAVGDIAVYVLADTQKKRFQLCPPILNVYPIAIYERKTYKDMIDTIKEMDRHENINNMQLSAGLVNNVPIVIFENALKVHNGSTDRDGKILQRKKDHGNLPPGSVLGFVNGIAARMRTLWSVSPINTLALVVQTTFKAMEVCSMPSGYFLSIPRPIPFLQVTNFNDVELSFKTFDLTPRHITSVNKSVNEYRQYLNPKFFTHYMLELFMELIGGQNVYLVFSYENTDEVESKYHEEPDACIKSNPMKNMAPVPLRYKLKPAIPSKYKNAKIYKPDNNDGQDIDVASSGDAHCAQPLTLAERPYFCGVAIELQDLDPMGTPPIAGPAPHIIGGLGHLEPKYIMYDEAIVLDDTTPIQREFMIRNIWCYAEQLINSGSYHGPFIGLTLGHLCLNAQTNNLILLEPNKNAAGIFTSLAPKLPLTAYNDWDVLEALDNKLSLLENRPPNNENTGSGSVVEKKSNTTDDSEVHYYKAVKRFVYASACGLVILLRMAQQCFDKLNQIRELEVRLGQMPNYITIDETEKFYNDMYLIEHWIADRNLLLHDIQRIAWFLNVSPQIIEPIIKMSINEYEQHILE